MTSRQKNGKAAKSAGLLGEHAAKRILGLAEPQVEIKTMQKERHKFSVELTQLERQLDKVYLIVAYSRGRCKSKGKRGKEKRTWEKSIKQAFSRSLEFVLVPTERLLELVRQKRFDVHLCAHTRDTGARFVARFRLDDVKDGTVCRTVGNDKHGLHFAYSTPETLERILNENRRHSGKHGLR